MQKYIPQYRPGIQYNFSDGSGFKNTISAVSELEAKRALRTLVDFMKTRTMQSHEMTFEPLLTQLIEKKDQYLF